MQNKRQKNNKKRGWTLIEYVIGAAIMAAVVVSVVTVIQGKLMSAVENIELEPTATP